MQRKDALRGRCSHPRGSEDTVGAERMGWIGDVGSTLVSVTDGE